MAMNRLFGTARESNEEALRRQNEIRLNSSGTSPHANDNIQQLEKDIARLETLIQLKQVKAIEARQSAKKYLAAKTQHGKLQATMALKDEESLNQSIHSMMVMMTKYRERKNALDNIGMYHNFQRTMGQSNKEIQKFLVRTGEDSPDMRDIALDDQQSTADIQKMNEIFNVNFGSILTGDSNDALDSGLDALQREIDAEEMEIRETNTPNYIPLQHQQQQEYYIQRDMMSLNLNTQPMPQQYYYQQQQHQQQQFQYPPIPQNTTTIVKPTHQKQSIGLLDDLGL
jgi:hypothetical protein